MKSSAKKIELASVDDLFSTEESRQDEQLEKIQEIPLSELHPFKDHPFKVKDDDAMIETADSIKKYGVLVPAIARPLPDGGYELVAGHRRRRASELAGKETMPVIVRDLDDDAATIIMVDSNLQRENLLPSERAFAYKMKLEAIKHQGARTDLTSVQVEQKLSARDQVAKEAGERSGIQVMRYVRLTELIPELLDMMDKLKKNMVFYLLLLIDFYIVPWFIKDTGSAMIVMLVIIPLICLITSVFYGIRNGFNFWYILIVAIMFAPSIFIFYNSSAWVYVVGYAVIALLGNLIALPLGKR